MCKKKGGAGGTNKFTILVFGGSRGAHSINSAMQNALPYLIKFKDRLRIIHQTGQDDLAEISRNYQEQAINGKVLPFIDDMASAYQAADLLICRSGATSIAEITAMGKAALLIPFPFATDNHQAKNAELLKEAGAAELIRDEDLTGELLAESISRLCHNPGIIKEMEEKSSKMGNPRAAEKIVDICYQMVSPQLDRPVTV